MIDNHGPPKGPGQGLARGEAIGALRTTAHICAPSLRPRGRIRAQLALMVAHQPQQLALGERATAADAATQGLYDSSSATGSGSASTGSSTGSSSAASSSARASCAAGASSTSAPVSSASASSPSSSSEGSSMSAGSPLPGGPPPPAGPPPPP